VIQDILELANKNEENELYTINVYEQIVESFWGETFGYT